MRTVVVGGGLSGLVVAWQLARRGQQVDLFEASDLIGGALASHTVAGVRHNMGAEAFATATPVVFELLRKLGLSEHVRQPTSGGSWILNVRGAFRSPAATYLGIPAQPLAPDVVALIGQDAAAHAAQEAGLDPNIGYHPGVSLGEYVAARMGRNVRDLLVEPVVGGVHSTHPDLLELDSIAPALHPAVLRHGSLQAAVAALRQGREQAGAAVAALAPAMALLTDTLAQQISAHGGRVHLNSPVQQVAQRRTEEGVPVGWNVALTSGNVEADQVVLATAPLVTQRLLSEVPVMAASIPSVPASAIALATLVVEDARLDAAPRNNGALVSSHTPGVVAKGLTHVTAKWAHLREAVEASAPGRHRHVLRLSYGRSGKHVPSRSELPDLALNDARRIMGCHLPREGVVAFNQVRWEQTITQARPGHQDALHEVAGRLYSHPGLAITGSWMAGTGIAAVTSHALQVADHLTGLHPQFPITAEPRAVLDLSQYTPATQQAPATHSEYAPFDQEPA